MDSDVHSHAASVIQPCTSALGLQVRKLDAGTLVLGDLVGVQADGARVLTGGMSATPCPARVERARCAHVWERIAALWHARASGLLVSVALLDVAALLSRTPTAEDLRTPGTHLLRAVQALEVVLLLRNTLLGLVRAGVALELAAVHIHLRPSPSISGAQTRSRIDRADSATHLHEGDKRLVAP